MVLKTCFIFFKKSMFWLWGEIWPYSLQVWALKFRTKKSPEIDSASRQSNEEVRKVDRQ